MFYVVFPFVRGWVEGYFDSLEKAKSFAKSAGFTACIFTTYDDDFVCSVNTY